MKEAFILRCCRWSFCVLLPFSSLCRTSAADLTEKLQKGLFEEEANHNLSAAIEQYKSVIADTDQQRKLTATAIYRLAECYRKLGREKEADELYGRLQRDFSEQTRFLAGKQIATQTAPSKPSSLADFMASERMAAIQPDLIASVVNQAQLRVVVNSLKGVDRTEAAVVLRVAYPSVLTEFHVNPDRDADNRFNSLLQQLSPYSSNIVAKTEKLETERKEIFASISPEAAVPLLQKLIRDLLATKKMHAIEIENLQAPGRAQDVFSQDIPHQGLFQELMMLGHDNIQKQPNPPDEKELEKKRAELQKKIDSREQLIRKGIQVLISSYRAANDALDQLLKSAEADYKQATGETATASSAQPNPYASMMRLLDNSPDLLNAAYATNGLTYLQNAVLSGNVELTKLLLDRGALVDKETPGGSTPLHLAVQKGHKSVAELLLKAGANVDAKTRSDQDRQVPPGSAPLHLAARNGFTALSELLLKNGAPIEAQDNELKTPLHRAAEAGQLEETRLLLAHGANIEAHNSWRGTPLFSAAAANQVPAVLLLLSSNAQMNISDTFGNTPLSNAARNSQRDLITAFLEKGADLNAQDREGNTALMNAIDKTDFVTIERLLKAKANPNLRDKEGLTALHHAVLKRDARILELLLNSGADPEIKDNLDQTALDYALGGARIPSDNRANSFMPASTTGAAPEIAGLLLDHGAKPNENHLWRALDTPDVLKRLLDEKINPNTKRGQEGRTPLDALKSNAIGSSDPTRQRSIQLLEQYGGTNTVSFPTNQLSFQQRLNLAVPGVPANQLPAAEPLNGSPRTVPTRRVPSQD